MRINPLVLSAILIGGTALCFQNCGEKDYALEAKAQASLENNNLGGDNDSSSSSTGGSGSSNSGSANGSGNVEIIAKNCNSASINSLSTNISFPTPLDISGTDSACDWKKNGNLTQIDQKIQARTEQYVNLSLPAGATICSMKFTFTDQPMIYDDQIILTYKGAVIATSYKALTDLLPKSAGLSMYNWDALKDL